MTPEAPRIDHISVPLGARYVPLGRFRRGAPRLVRFEGHARDVLYADYGAGLRRITPAAPAAPPSAHR